MSLRKIIDAALHANQDTMRAGVASRFIKHYDVSGNWTWGVDVDIGEDMTSTLDSQGRPRTSSILYNTPIALNNRDVLYAQMGWPVTISKMGGVSQYAVTGLSKSRRAGSNLIYVSFAESIGVIVKKEIRGTYERHLTYGELGSLGGYGDVPYGGIGRFNAQDDSLNRILEGAY